MDNNTISVEMVAGAAAAFYLGASETSLWRRWLAFVLAAFMVHVPMFSDSRGGMVGILVVAAAIIGVQIYQMIARGTAKRFQPMYLLYLVLAVGVGWRLAGQGVWERFGTLFDEEQDTSVDSRRVLWGQAWDLMVLEPLFGVGPAHFPIRVAPLWNGVEKAGHSLWMQTGAELGFPGLAFLALFYGSIAVRMWQLYRRKAPTDDWVRHCAVMVFVSLVGFAVTASFVTVEGVEPPYYLAMVGAGLLMLTSDSNSTTDKGLVRQPARAATPVPT